MVDLSKLAVVCKDCMHPAEHIANWQEVAITAILCVSIVFIVFIVFLYISKEIDKIIEYKKGVKEDRVKKIILDLLKNDPDVKTSTVNIVQKLFEDENKNHKVLSVIVEAVGNDKRIADIIKKTVENDKQS